MFTFFILIDSKTLSVSFFFKKISQTLLFQKGPHKITTVTELHFILFSLSSFLSRMTLARRPAAEVKPRHQRDSRRDHLQKRTVLRYVSCEMTTKPASLAAAIVVAPQLDGVAHHAVHLIAKVTQPVDW